MGEKTHKRGYLLVRPGSLASVASERGGGWLVSVSVVSMHLVAHVAAHFEAGGRVFVLVDILGLYYHYYSLYMMLALLSFLVCGLS